MKKHNGKLIVLAFLCLGVNASIGEQYITIMNVAAVDDRTMESVRAYAERELYVPVIATKVTTLSGRDLQDYCEHAAKLKKITVVP